MYLKRTFHPVGQGLFCTERYSSSEGWDPIFNIVYDCGTLNERGLVERAINREFGPLPSCEADKVQIDCMYISHFHADHINGISTLRKYCKIHKYVAPVMSTGAIVEAYIFNLIHDASANKVVIDILKLNSEQVEYVDVEDQKVGDNPYAPYWLIMPYMVKKFDDALLEHEMRKGGFGDLWDAFEERDFAKVDNLFNQYEISRWLELKKIYEKMGGGEHSYMLTLYSGYYSPGAGCNACNALYCGDYEAKDAQSVDDLLRPLQGRWPYVGTLQVPHHGSENNSCPDLYDNERHCVISYGAYRFKHPHIRTIKLILNAQKGRALDTLHLVDAFNDYVGRYII